MGQAKRRGTYEERKQAAIVARIHRQGKEAETKKVYAVDLEASLTPEQRERRVRSMQTITALMALSYIPGRTK